MPLREESFVIEQTPPGERLDHYLHRIYPGMSRGALQRLLAEGAITVDGQTAKPSHHPRAGEQVDIRWPEPKTAEAQPEAIPLNVLYEDRQLLVINKPSGLVVHPAAGNQEHTLVNALLHHCAGQLSGIGGVARPGIVHRLDKDTSGCLVAAKTDCAHQALASQFQDRGVLKIYAALLCGELTSPKGDIRAAIARNPVHRQRMTVTEAERGRKAWTSYQVREHMAGATLVEARLHTGRTHQIRVHFQHLGYPLAGDATYGERATKRLTELTGYRPPRLMLHAWRLAFTHPETGQRLQFEAPLPEEFQAAVATLKRK